MNEDMGQMTCTWFLFAIIDSGTLAALNPLDLYFSICRVGGITMCWQWKDCWLLPSVCSLLFPL